MPQLSLELTLSGNRLAQLGGKHSKPFRTSPELCFAASLQLLLQRLELVRRGAGFVKFRSQTAKLLRILLGALVDECLHLCVRVQQLDVQALHAAARIRPCLVGGREAELRRLQLGAHAPLLLVPRRTLSGQVPLHVVEFATGLIQLPLQSCNSPLCSMSSRGFADQAFIPGADLCTAVGCISGYAATEALDVCQRGREFPAQVHELALGAQLGVAELHRVRPAEVEVRGALLLDCNVHPLHPDLHLLQLKLIHLGSVLREPPLALEHHAHAI
mmetsp:Transcript_122529/g.392088  ORF Transcript_122529/g.392088 Transcript_122529/m.392088 type:complete len:273 (-) Transcript_122529:404-1222(-)